MDLENRQRKNASASADADATKKYSSDKSKKSSHVPVFPIPSIVSTPFKSRNARSQ